MKKLKPLKFKFLEDLGSNVAAAVIILVITTTISFAWSTNTRITRLEEAITSLASDLHDIKGLLEKQGQHDGR